MLLRPPALEHEEYRKIGVTPLSGALGAEIHGVDLSRSLEDAAWREVYRAFLEFHVLVFRDQDISNERHAEFAARFGNVIRMPQHAPFAGHALLQSIDRDAEDVGAFYGSGWHSDIFDGNPPLCVVMRALEVPASGGDTAFSNLHIAYETLSPKMRSILDDLETVQGKMILGSRDLSVAEREKQLAEIDAETPVTIHPLVRVHPISGRKFISLNLTFVRRFDGMTAGESRPLLEFLYSHCSQVEFTCRITWRKGQIVVWDNCATQHTAIGDYQGMARRMVRATVQNPLGA